MFNLEMANNILGLPILSLICYIPILGALIIVFFFNKEKTVAIKNFALFVTFVDLAVSLLLLKYFDPSSAHMQFAERVPWIPTVGIEYFFAIDGISILLILLTTVLMPISVLCSYAAITERQKEYYVCLLFLQTGMLGAFMALDCFLFYVFWEVMLVPMYFLIGMWGHGRKLYSAIKFFLFTLFGGIFMLLGILSLYFLNHAATGEFTFNALKFVQLQVPNSPIFMGLSVQDLLFLAFFIGFAIKVPMFPFHTWLPDAHTDAPTAGSVILAGVLLKMGTYGFVRFSLPLFPESSATLVPFMAVLAIIGIIYGALVSLGQKELKRLIAYSSVSHLGFVMLGVFALNPQGIIGGMIQMISHGISTGALFLIAGIIYERRHTYTIADFGGLTHKMPIFATLFAISMLSSLGLPGLNGFVGEFLILVGIFKESYVYAALAAVGIILGAAYLLWLYQRVMLGNLDKPENEKVWDCNFREVAYMMPLIVLMFWIGLYPKPFLKLMEPTVINLVENIRPGYTDKGSSIAGKNIILPDIKSLRAKSHTKGL